MRRHYLLDSFFVIDLLNELAKGKPGKAMNWLRAHPRAQLWISPVTMAEVLEGAVDAVAVASYLSRFQWQGIHRSHALAAAAFQRRSDRRMGENDAWQVAVAGQMEAIILGNYRAFRRLGAAYECYR